MVGGDKLEHWVLVICQIELALDVEVSYGLVGGDNIEHWVLVICQGAALLVRWRRRKQENYRDRLWIPPSPPPSGPATHTSSSQYYHTHHIY